MNGFFILHVFMVFAQYNFTKFLKGKKINLKMVICQQDACIKQNLSLRLETGPLPMASGCTQDVGKVFLNMDLLLVIISHNFKKHPVCNF